MMEDNLETQELQPITKELLDSLSGWERAEALKKYLEWQERERKVQRGLAIQLDKKLYRFENRLHFNEYQRKYQREYYQKYNVEIKARRLKRKLLK